MGLRFLATSRCPSGRTLPGSRVQVRRYACGVEVPDNLAMHIGQDAAWKQGSSPLGVLNLLFHEVHDYNIAITAAIATSIRRLLCCSAKHTLTKCRHFNRATRCVWTAVLPCDRGNRAPLHVTDLIKADPWLRRKKN